MKIINNGHQPLEIEKENIICVSQCTEEPGDNCWLQLD